jgi:hypothetical protein
MEDGTELKKLHAGLTVVETSLNISNESGSNVGFIASQSLLRGFAPKQHSLHPPNGKALQLSIRAETVINSLIKTKRSQGITSFALAHSSGGSNGDDEVIAGITSGILS